MYAKRLFKYPKCCTISRVLRRIISILSKSVISPPNNMHVSCNYLRGAVKGSFIGGILYERRPIDCNDVTITSQLIKIQTVAPLPLLRFNHLILELNIKYSEDYRSNPGFGLLNHTLSSSFFDKMTREWGLKRGAKSHKKFLESVTRYFLFINAI